MKGLMPKKGWLTQMLIWSAQKLIGDPDPSQEYRICIYIYIILNVYTLILFMLHSRERLEQAKQD